jgi:hypothetical protein
MALPEELRRVMREEAIPQHSPYDGRDDGGVLALVTRPPVLYSLDKPPKDYRPAREVPAAPEQVVDSLRLET